MAEQGASQGEHEKQMAEPEAYARDGTQSLPSPTLSELQAAATPNPRQALRQYCDWIMDNRGEGGDFRYVRAWYLASYPLRTLIAGYELFHEQSYLDTVTRCLDKFVSEQLPNSAWTAGMRNKPTAELDGDELKARMSKCTNVADVGSIATCLAVAYPHVDDERKSVYGNALKRYADDFAAQWQLPSGAFTNGIWDYRPMNVPYSVATGTGGMCFCALHAITGDEAYLKIAERAAGFLLTYFLEDGRVIHHHHCEDKVELYDATRPGDIYYSHEAILWAWHWTKDEALKEKTRRVYGWHVKGEHGLLQARENNVFWPYLTAWHNSKACAMPLILIEYDRSMAADPDIHEAVERCGAFLSIPQFALRRGVMRDVSLPKGRQFLAATGFGGLALAELVQPGIIYLRPHFLN